MADAIAYIILGIIGFFIGGLIGSSWYEGFSPYCWYGLCLVWGIPFAAQASCEIGD